MPVEKLIKASLLVEIGRINKILSKLIDFRLFHVLELGQERTEEIEDLIQNLSRISAELDNLSSELGIKRDFGVLDYLANKVQLIRTEYEFTDLKAFVQDLKLKLEDLSKSISPLLEERRKLAKELEEISTTKSNLEYISKLGIRSEFLKALKRVFYALVVVNSKTLLELKRSLPEDFFLISEKLTEDLHAVLIVGKLEQAEKANRILGGLEARQIKFPEDKVLIEDSIRDLENKINDYKIKLNELQLKISYESKRKYYDLLSLYELAYLQYLNVLNIRLNKPLKNFVVIEGFIPYKYKDDFKKVIGDDAFIEFNETVGKDLPSLIVNKPVIKSFENITFMQGPAAYHEVEPTPFVFLFFSLFYGFMYADLGGGLLIVLLGLLLYLRAAKGLKQWGVMLITLGISSSFFGILHNEFFGFKIPFVSYKPVFELIEHAHNSLNSSSVIFILQLSIIIGIFHLSLGMILRFINGLKANNKDDILLAISYLTFYISSVLLMYGLLSFNLDITAYSVSEEKILGIPAYIYSRIFAFSTLAGILFLLFSRYLAHKLSGHEHINAKSLIGEGALEVFDAIPRLLANTISYVRLAILVIVHTLFLLYIKSVTVLYFGNPVLTTIIVGMMLVLGNLGIAVLEGFIVFIQALRLHLYEWFTKFYYGDGKFFKEFYNEGFFSKVRFKLEK